MLGHKYRQWQDEGILTICKRFIIFVAEDIGPSFLCNKLAWTGFVPGATFGNDKGILHKQIAGQKT